MGEAHTQSWAYDVSHNELHRSSSRTELKLVIGQLRNCVQLLLHGLNPQEKQKQKQKLLR